MAVIAPELFPLRRARMFTAARDAFLRANPTIDPHILADALGLTARTIYMYQRKLGIRMCTWHDHGATQ
jgi:hypothetical protein